MGRNLVGRRLPLRALLLAGGLMAGTATLAQDASTASKPFYCFAFMNPLDGRGFESAYSSIMLGSPKDEDDLERAFYRAAKAAGTLNGYIERSSSGCSFYDDAGQASAARDQNIDGFRRNNAHVQKYYAGELAWDGDGLASPLPAKGKKATAPYQPAKAAEVTDAENLAAPEPAAPKYVEVPDGNGGTIRLSQAVAARNKAAQEEYARKMQEHSDAIAKAKAENERRAAQHAESMARAAAEKQEYERKLAANAAQVAAQKAQTGSPIGGTEGTFKATSTYRATREEAMYEMTSHHRAPISNIQCAEVTFYKPAKWACWGTYRQTVTRSSTSKQ